MCKTQFSPVALCHCGVLALVLGKMSPNYLYVELLLQGQSDSLHTWHTCELGVVDVQDDISPQSVWSLRSYGPWTKYVVNHIEPEGGVQRTTHVASIKCSRLKLKKEFDVQTFLAHFCNVKGP